ncbi:MAG: hypothetical protein ABR592_04610 [Nitriliruptorales bacterium]
MSSVGLAGPSSSDHVRLELPQRAAEQAGEYVAGQVDTEGTRKAELKQEAES